LAKARNQYFSEIDGRKLGERKGVRSLVVRRCKLYLLTTGDAGGTVTRETNRLGKTVARL